MDSNNSEESSKKEKIKKVTVEKFLRKKEKNDD